MKYNFKLSNHHKKKLYTVFPASFLIIIFPFIIHIPVKFAVIIMVLISIASYWFKSPELILSSFIFLFGAIVTYTNPYDYNKTIMKYINPPATISIENASMMENLDVHEEKVEAFHIAYFISSFMLWLVGTIFIRIKIYSEPDKK